jgi:hypothetical protein
MGKCKEGTRWHNWKLKKGLPEDLFHCVRQDKAYGVNERLLEKVGDGKKLMRSVKRASENVRVRVSTGR